MKPSKWAATLNKTNPNPMIQLIIDMHQGIVELSVELEKVQGIQRQIDQAQSMLERGLAYALKEDFIPVMRGEKTYIPKEVAPNAPVEFVGDVDSTTEFIRQLETQSVNPEPEPKPEPVPESVDPSAFELARLRREVTELRVKTKALQDENDALLRKETGH